MRRQTSNPRSAVLGVGLDASDGHTRITRGEGFFLAGGSEETHAEMRETVTRVAERLSSRGKRIRDAEPQELRDLFHEAHD